jgi:hypothetical protein
MSTDQLLPAQVGRAQGLLRRGWKAWAGLAQPTRRLLSARFWRSISQGALVVGLALYLHALGWSGAAIGIVLSGGGLAGAALNRGTTGVRQALVVSAVHDERRGFAASLNALSMQVPRALGPTFACAMIGAGWFITPFYVAAAFQCLYVLLYGRVFAPFERVVLAGNDD